MKHKIYLGTSGWSYKHWRGTFYPTGLKAKDEFDYYLEYFDSVEINNSFYKLPSAGTFDNWYNAAPDDFVYVVKASRFITHAKKLRDPQQSSNLFFDRVIHLREKLGAILFQLPPMFKANVERLDEFLGQLPKGMRYVFEFRNTDWYNPEVYNVLRKHNTAFCIYDLAGHQSPMTVTADFVYWRLHGPGEKYQGSYSDDALTEIAKTCKNWLKNKDVFVYFDNDEKGFAAFNAIRLKELIG